MLEQLPIEERIARLEGKLGWGPLSETRALSPRTFSFALGLSLTASISCYIGLGLSNHVYQLVLAAMTVALCYHRHWLVRPRKSFEWILAGLNTFVLSMLFKLVLGGGLRKPFFWLMYPQVKQPAENESWVPGLPKLALEWQASAFSEWSVDLTIIQTFLMVITLIGALFSFQPFISFTAFLLILLSIPALVGFNWDWVFPGMVIAALSLYIQSGVAQDVEEPQ